MLKFTRWLKSSRTVWIIRQPVIIASCCWQHCYKQRYLSSVATPTHCGDGCFRKTIFISSTEEQCEVVEIVRVGQDFMKGSNKVSNQSRMTAVLDDRQHRPTSVMWREWMNLYGEINREITEECNISFSSCQEILTKKLRTTHVVAKSVPLLMTEEQKHRVDVLRASHGSCGD